MWYIIYILTFFAIIGRSDTDSSASWASRRYVLIISIREDVYADKGMSATTDATVSLMWND